MKVLITGGAGFIGSHLTERLIARGDEVWILDDLSTGRRENLPLGFNSLIVGSVADRNAVRSALKEVDIVFHLAALVSVEEASARPSRAFELNVLGTSIVLEESAAAGVDKVVFASSSSVYGSDCPSPQREGFRERPSHPYAISKLSGEQMLEFHAGMGHCKGVSLRFFNVFGPRQNPDSPYSAVIPVFARNAARSELLTVTGDGSQTRDFIFVADVARALEFAADHLDDGVFNVGCGRETSIRELAEKIVAISGGTSMITYGAARPGDIARSCAFIRKLAECGWRPLHSLDMALEAMMHASRIRV